MLDLSYNYLHAPGARALAAANFPGLLELRLCNAGLRGADAAALAAVGKNLRSLRLEWSYITAAGASALATGNWPFLEFLSPEGNVQLGDAGAAALAAASWTSLLHLSLSDTDLGAAGAAALAAAN